MTSSQITWSQSRRDCSSPDRISVSSQDRRTAACEASFAKHAADKRRAIGIKLHPDGWAYGWENTKASEKTNHLESPKERLMELTRYRAAALCLRLAQKGP